MIRKPIITVLGHVDHGKTKFLDKIRGTAIVQKEAGNITQHIGATEVPIEAIEKISSKMIAKFGFKLTIPGLLFIDTPGHEAFTNLRKRGGSIADLAVLIIDVNQLAQKQTFESIEILKVYKTPFIVAANKIDKIQGWVSRDGEVLKNIEMQNKEVKEFLDKQIYEIVGQLHSRGFNSERYDRCGDLTKEIPIVPISAMTGEGLPELLMFLAGLSQKFLGKKLDIGENEIGKGTILEVKDEKGLGTTIDVILYQGNLKVSDRIVLVGKNGVIETKIRALLQPKPMEEIRESKDKFNKVDEVYAAVGVKIVAPNLDSALAGSPVMVEQQGDEKNIICEELGCVKIECEALGAIIKTDALGSLEALTKLLENEGLTIKSANVGDVTRREIIEANAVREKDCFKGVIFAFNVKVDDELMKDAEKTGVKIFKGNVIYKLIEDYQVWTKEQQEALKKQKLEELTLPAKFNIIPGFIFRNNKPAVVGVKIIAGRLRPGVKVLNKGKIVGLVKKIEANNEKVQIAEKNDEVAVSIEKGNVGRNIFEKDVLYAYIPKNQFSELDKYKIYLNAEERELLEEMKEIESKEITEDEGE
ncbi:MAG: translation initiation factor IF-2 [Candidatus Diapherotrites archaeon]